jgi:O-succinylbenzoate synthase
MLDPLVKAGFQKVKVKVGVEMEPEIEMLNRAALTHDVKIRLDFNSRLTWNTFESYMKGLTPAAKRMIEYLEDPFPYEKDLWKEARQILPLAADWALRDIPLNQEEPIQADVLVIKPTHEDVNGRIEQCQKWGCKMVVTSNMGHPVGVMQCNYIAQDLAKRFAKMMLDPGCLTFDQFEPTEFNSVLNVTGPFVKRVAGWGIGFDFVLKSQKWNSLKSQV